MLHLRLMVPAGISARVVELLANDARATHVVVLADAGVDPPGDLVMADVAREAASALLDDLRDLGVDDRCGIALDTVEAAPSKGARLASEAAPGAADDAVVWDVVLDRAAQDVEPSWSFYAFLTLATLLAAIAVITDSAILVVGAMVVGPEFGPVAALAVGLALRNLGLMSAAARLLLLGFLFAVAATTVTALAARWGGWIAAHDLLRPRPLTNFIWRPDKWSFVVALLAGAAGVLSVTAGRSNALVGVFISVTTVPAAGNLAVALALWQPGEIVGSVLQLGVNLAGMTAAGTLVLVIARYVTRRRELGERASARMVDEPRRR